MRMSDWSSDVCSSDLDLSGRNRGITINSFSSVSLEPPLILFCLDRETPSFDSFCDAGRFAVNVLRAEQHSLSVRFATAAADKWNGIPYDLWPGDLPVLRGCLASLACRREAVHEGGDQDRKSTRLNSSH